ncbi:MULTISPECIES: NAD-dependent epimerase/dehydratase family protein [unclassified Sphingobium]|uniref:NAD-dependent epimerase/dehydratase family protein n=1 Tax=unclassified Sphingobium TaxID=2611147 RepID=UPI00119A9303|nr:MULTISPECIES: NAD(P)-dependent oxidoreductase [unclassified Sphingobium]MBG6119966.1 nucleoside-diphosphate-sugar epimerase [Sphingobium sp. JAI105]TWC99595.1 nucleoside-diphosphate-sugar epimerase [Sphingobium sp. AEW010]TWD18968.1 nucleoside-diphosphate-sugar epimerase [Sphingobium sp. AEW013]TWD21839.1 nucleoside-diphosphate-sugar epimerase [Sphingobium sp. AEW001]
MLNGQKILVTGVGGAVATPLAAFLARNNEVWGAARFGDPSRREKVEAAGIRAVAIDLAGDDLSTLPTDFTHVLHLAWIRCTPGDFAMAARVNSQAAGRVIQHCRSACGILITSSTGVYSPHPDPYFRYREDHYLGRGCTDEFLAANATVRLYNPTSSAAKIATEAVARFAARSLDVPLTIARLNSVYGTADMFPARYIKEVLAGQTIIFPNDPCPHTPVHIDDMCAHVAPLLAAASVDATTVNWCGDEVVDYQDYARLAAQWAGVAAKLDVLPLPGYPPGNVSDNSLRLSLTGPCRQPFRTAYRTMYDAVAARGSA